MQFHGTGTAVYYGDTANDDSDPAALAAGRNDWETALRHAPAAGPMVMPALAALQQGRFEDARQASGVIGKAIGRIADALEDQALANLRRHSALSCDISALTMAALALSAQPAQPSQPAQENVAAQKRTADSAAALARDWRAVQAPGLAARDNGAATGTAIGDAGRAIDDALPCLDDIDSRLQELAKAAAAAASMLHAVEEISNQANLLALNTTVEATRAGETGGRFAMVACEIKALAQQASHVSDAFSQSTTALTAGMTALSEAVSAGRARLAASAGDLASAGKAACAMNQQLSLLVDAFAPFTRSLDEHARLTGEPAKRASTTPPPPHVRDATALLQHTEHARGLIGDCFTALRKFDLETAPLEYARAGHMAGLARIGEVLAGMADIDSLDMIQNHERCPLSQWIAAEIDGARVDGDLLNQLADKHQRVHALRDVVIAAMREGMKPQASAAFAPLQQATYALLDVLELTSGEIERVVVERRRVPLLGQ